MSHQMDKRKIIGPIVILTLLGSYTAFELYKMYQPEPKILYGSVEAQAYDIQSLAAGQLSAVTIHEGDPVKSGAVVAQLDATEVSLKTSQAELSLQNAQNELGKLNDGARSEEIAMQSNVVNQVSAQISAYKGTLSKLEALVSQAKTGVQQAERTLKDRSATLNDAKALYASDATAQTALESAQLVYDQAKLALDSAKSLQKASEADLAAGKNQLKSLQAQQRAAEDKLALVKKPIVERQLTTGNLAVEQAKKGIALSQTLQDKYKVTSQLDGIVQTVYFDKGECVAIGSTIATVIDPHETWAYFYATEKMLPDLKVGQEVYLKATINGVETTGKIVAIAQKAEYTPVNIVTTKDREKLVFRVKVDLNEVEGIQPGMLLSMTWDKEAAHGDQQ